MGMHWTEEQEAVIRHREGNLLVAAAAGSGKTAVLVEHILERITDPEDPVSLSEMVVMTFTDAAAQEMRERIRKGLLERLRKEPQNERLVREAGNIQNADICTIDAFCKHLITENYAVIGLDPAFRLGEQGELNLLKGDIIRELLEQHYEEQDEQFLRFVDSYTRGKDDTGIEELILKVYEYASANPWPKEYLDEAEKHEQNEAENHLLHTVCSRLHDFAEEYRHALEICEEEDGPEGYIPTLTEELNRLTTAEEAETPEQLSEAVQRISFGRLKASKAEKKGLVTPIRDRVKKEVQNLQKQLILPEPAVREKVQQGIDENIHVLVTLTREFMERFHEEKSRRRMLDFSDLEHCALEILYTGEGAERKPSSIADDYAGRLREILVDEYQDSNYVQEALVEALSAERFGRPDVFQVGDVKQSIYSFRLARPDLFLEKYRDSAYPKIELSSNFRSRKEVLDAANAVFFRVMKEEVGGILYTEESSLHPGRILSESELAKDCHTELHLVSVQDGDGNNAMDKTEAETRVIAARIRKLREEGYHYRDMVILLRSPGSIADTMVSVLGNEGVPAYCTSSEGYFSAVEVETVLSLLSIINNPRQSIPLAAVLRSPIYGFTDEELAEIVVARGGLEHRFAGEEALRQPEEAENEENETSADDEAAIDKAEEIKTAAAAEAGARVTAAEEAAAEKGSEKTEASAVPEESEEKPLSPALQEKLDNFYRELSHFRELSHYLSIHELLYRIYDETGYYNYVSAQPAGERRRANLDQLIDSALAFEKTSYRGLFDFIRYIEKLKKYNNDQGEASVLSEQNDLVRIMSIHKSKGLQFPVVFLAGLGRRINKMDLSGNVLIDPSLGIATDYVDPERRIRYPSLRKLGVREKIASEQLGEELRVLYVAMTRAENKLIMSGTCADPEKAIARYGECGRTLSGSTIRSAACLLDWILMAEGERLWQTHGPIRLYTDNSDSLLKKEESELADTVALAEDFQTALFAREPAEAERQQAESCRNYRYPHEAATKLFPKHTVSEIREREEAAEGVKVVETGAEKPEKAGAEGGKPPKLDDMQNTENFAAPGIAIRIDTSGSTEQYAFLEVEENAASSTAGKPQGGARRGTVMHRILAQYDFSKGPEQLQLLPEEDRKLADIPAIRRFLDSPLGQRLKKADQEGKLFREQRFMTQVPYNYLFRDSEVTEPVLLQGVADAFILADDGILLLDYKTDRVRDPEILKQRYALQLGLYADALSAVTGRPVKERLLYSFALGQSIEVLPEN